MEHGSAQTLSFRACVTLAAVVCCLPSLGCNSWGPSSQVRQSQLESERLLAEFRAQKRRADELEAKNTELANRLAETEKLMARMQNGSSVPRLSSADTIARPAATRPAASAPSAERINGNLPPTSNTPESAIQWRPIAPPVR